MRCFGVACLLAVVWLGPVAVAAAQNQDLPPLPPPPPPPSYNAPAPGPGQQTTPAKPAPAASAPAEPAPSGAPETPSEQAPATSPPPPATPQAEAACVPACRSGYVCVQGVCLSACNPPCAAGQLCSADAQCIAPPPAFPPPEAPKERIPDPTAERHDGLMARVTLGFGGASVKGQNTGTAGVVGERDFSGGVVNGSFDLGGTLAENLVLHGRFGFTSTLSTPRIDGATQPSSDYNSGNAILLAPAITYYFMPINLYATGAIGFTWIIERWRDNLGDDYTHRSQTGVGLNIDLGKEWWVNDQWGFGATGRFLYSYISKNNERDTAAGFVVLFSATYQ